MKRLFCGVRLTQCVQTFESFPFDNYSFINSTNVHFFFYHINFQCDLSFLKSTHTHSNTFLLPISFSFSLSAWIQFSVFFFLLLVFLFFNKIKLLICMIAMTMTWDFQSYSLSCLLFYVYMCVVHNVQDQKKI